jgi:hypothetical protein
MAPEDRAMNEEIRRFLGEHWAARGPVSLVRR